MTIFYFAKSRIIYHWNISAILFLSLSLYHVQPANGREEPVFRLKDIRELEEEGGGGGGHKQKHCQISQSPLLQDPLLCVDNSSFSNSTVAR